MTKDDIYKKWEFHFLCVSVKFSYVCGNKPVKTEQNVKSNNL